MKFTPIMSAMLEAKTSVRARRFDGASSPRPKRMGRESAGMAQARGNRSRSQRENGSCSSLKIELPGQRLSFPLTPLRKLIPIVRICDKTILTDPLEAKRFLWHQTCRCYLAELGWVQINCKEDITNDDKDRIFRRIDIAQLSYRG